jgi:hypothetical protein
MTIRSPAAIGGELCSVIIRSRLIKAEILNETTPVGQSKSIDSNSPVDASRITRQQKWRMRTEFTF